MTRVLCVAEKPSIAKSISQILSGGQFQTEATRSNYIKNYKFPYPQTNSLFVVTSVVGHLTSADFHESHRKWHSCDPFELFEAPVKVEVHSDKKAIESNLKTLARSNDVLMIWTDCDREGEHIGWEIWNVCRSANRNLTLKRARFSAIIAEQIHRAAQRPVNLDKAQADAVEARILIDLKIGAAFTRMQTLALQPHLPQTEGEKAGMISYGSCQFPTLGFVVQRYQRVKDFVPEPFWYIHLMLSYRNDQQELEPVEFKWKRGHIFDRDFVTSLFEHVLTFPRARVVTVTRKQTKKWKPLPLTTVELQKAGSRLLRMAPKKVLDIAERLYQQGFLSYPRTETDQYDNQFDFQSLITKLAAENAPWLDFARRLQGDGFSPPRKGKNNDHAHPPIHPTNFAGNLAGDEKKVYDYITRRFLASCSKDAIGDQTTIEVDYGGEQFSASGVIVMERNYLDVYPYDKWTDCAIPLFEEGTEFEPTVCEMKEGETSKPNLLTEADLVTLMDKNGIGTDATIAQHVQTIIDRDYVIERMEGSTKYLVPSTLGVGLIEGYNQIGLEKSVSKPQLRRETERAMMQVCQGTLSKEEMLAQSINQYKDMFVITRREFDTVVRTVRQYLEGRGDPGAGALRRGGGGGGGGAGGGGGNNDDSDDNGGGGGGGGRGGRGGGRGSRGGRGRGRGAAAATTTTTGRGRGRGRGRPPRGATAPSSDSGEDFDFGNPPPPPAPAPAPAARRTSSTAASSQAGPSSFSTAKPPSTRYVPPPPARNNSLGTTVLQCNCGVPAASRTVTKESMNKGRKFWTCGEPNSCGFFAYADDSPPNSSTIPAKRPHPGNASSGETPSCRCNPPQEAIMRTVVKEGPNKGRQFYKCPQPSEQQCTFFAWADEEVLNGNDASRSGGMSRTGSGYGTSSQVTTGDCFKCGKPGHWSSACPDSGNSGFGGSQSKSFGSSTNTAGTCYKCHEPGHFAPDCPNGNSGRTVKSKGTSGGGEGDCYKCGKAGHWAKDCPGDKGMGRGSSFSGTGSRGGRRGSRTPSSGSARAKRGGRGGKKKSAFGAADGR